MHAQTSTPDRYRATVLVRVPECLDDAQRREKYDVPLALAIRDAGAGDFVGGVSKLGGDGQAESVVLQLTLHYYHSISVVIEALLKIGAPPETVVEAETETATLSLSLAEAAGG
jgi:hypothetical protein